MVHVVLPAPGVYTWLTCGLMCCSVREGVYKGALVPFMLGYIVLQASDYGTFVSLSLVSRLRMLRGRWVVLSA